MPCARQWRASAASSAGCQHGPGGVARAGDHQTVNWRLDRLQQLDRRLEGRLHAEAEAHDLDAERLQDVLVGRKGGLGHHDPIAGVERGQEAEHEGTRRADRDDDLPRIDLEVVARPAMLGDRRSERRPPERFGVAQGKRSQSAPGGVQGSGGRTGAGLADLEMHDVLAARGALVRCGEHVHGDEGRNPGPPGDLDRHAYSRLRFVSPPFCHSRPASASDGRRTGGPGPVAQRHPKMAMAPCSYE